MARFVDRNIFMHFCSGGIAHTTHPNISKANRVSQNLFRTIANGLNDTRGGGSNIELPAEDDLDAESNERMTATTRTVLTDSDCESNAGDIELDEDPLLDDDYDY